MILNTISNSLVHAIQMKKITTAELNMARLEIENSMVAHAIDNADDIDV